MTRARTFRSTLLIFVVLSLWAQTSLADGVALRSGDLPKRDRDALRAEIVRARTDSPLAFERVAGAPALAIKFDARRHGRYATITPHLKRLGPSALLPMLDALAFDGPARAGMSDGAWLTLRVGLLEAVGSLRDPRAVPVLEAILDQTSVEPEVTRAAAEALGRIGSDRAVRKLVAASRSQGARQRAIVQGMADCRRLAMARHIASWLQRKPDDPLALDLVKAMGSVGNAWAWKASTAHASEQDATRALAAGTLVQAFVRHDGDVREAAAKALLVVDHPSAKSLVERETLRARSASLRAELETLSRRFAENPIREK
jgi:RNase P/RNase MRP subunit POP5